MRHTGQEVMQSVEKFFSHVGIDHEVVTDADPELTIIHAAFRINIKPEGGEPFEAGFPLTVLLVRDAFDDLYVRFTIAPFIEKESPELPAVIYRELAEINNRIPLLKFAVDGDGDIELLADMSAPTVSRDALERTMRTMADYVNMCFPYLLGLMSPDAEGDS